MTNTPASLSPGPTSPRARWWAVARWVEHGLAGIGALGIIYHVAFTTVIVSSPSMSPTLRGNSFHDGDRVLIERLSLRLFPPRRWEIVVFESPELGLVLKRVVGLPGDRLQLLRGGKLLINGTPVELPSDMQSVRYLPYGNLADEKVFDCGDGYYMLGDASHDSDDARFHGVTKPWHLVGRMFCRLGSRAETTTPDSQKAR